MRKSLLFVAKMFLVALFPFVTSCGIDDVDAEDGAIVFELYDDEGSLVEGLQSMKFGETTAYTLKSAFVTYTEVIAPTGWKCSVIPSSRSCTISAPALSDLEAEAGGDITINIQSQSGRTLSYTIKVAALEDDVVLTFDGSATTDRLIYSYGKSMAYTYSSENVASLDVEMPAGWTYENDLDAGTLTVTAPTKEFENPTLIGEVKVTPLSIRSTAGTSSAIPVELSTKMPVIEFQQEAYRFRFGEQMDIPCSLSYIDQCDITAPDGWTATLDKENSQLKVTAPAADAGATNGTLVFDAASEDGLTDSFRLDVAIYGISTAEEFIAFGEAVTAGAPLDDYTLDNEIVLHQNIDLSASQLKTFVGSAEQPFTGVFNGNGKTINVNLSGLGDTKEMGLFHTLGATARIKDLTLSGSISVTSADPTVAGTLAVYDDGAAFSNVTNTATVYFSGAKTRSTAGYLGGLTGQVRASSQYSNCHNTGAFNITGTARTVFIGGLIGGALIGTKGSITDCSNTGTFTFNFSGAVDSGMYGGLVGSAEKATWTYTNCTNEGDFTVTLADPGHQFHSLGGIVANGYGTFENCVNKGSISYPNANGTKYRRTGGIVGCVGADKKEGEEFDRILKMTNCRNEGELAASTAAIGGLIGIAEKLDAAALIEDCVNTGNLSSPTMGQYDLYYMGGIAGKVAGEFTLRRCVNRGNLTAAVERDIAGITTSGNNGAIFEACENYGNITVAPNHKTDKWRPIVAGIVAIENDVTTTITNCTCDCTIDATLYQETSVDKVYVFQKKWEKGTEDTKTVCDEASKSNSAGTVINITLKE